MKISARTGLISLACLSFAAAPAASAATRTVQFVGNVVSHLSKIRVDQFQDFYACSVVIVNTGSTDQLIQQVEFFTFVPPAVPGPGVPSILGSTGPSTDIIYNTASASFGPGMSTVTPVCTGAGGDCTVAANRTVPANGGVYAAIAYIDSSAFGGKLVTPCAGKLVIKDKVDAQPGSVVASGSVTYVSELGITGGQFSGAMYLSGSHVEYSNPNVALQSVYQNASAVNNPNPGNTPPNPYSLSSTFNGLSGSEAMQMNLFCAQACYRSVNTADGAGYATLDGDPGFCNAACGMETAYSSVGGFPDPVSGDVNKYRNVFGYLEESVPTSPVVPLPNAAATPLPFHENTYPSNANTPPAIGNSPRQLFRGLFRTANPHWAGGYVVEMIMGPFDSICSGNNAYFQNGNTDFSHIDTIDSDAALVMASPRNTTKGPPERLFCAHNHMKDSPFGYVSNGIPFAVNGGLAF